MNIIHTGNKHSDITVSELNIIDSPEQDIFSQKEIPQDSFDLIFKIKESPVQMVQTMGTKIKEFFKNSLDGVKKNITTLDEKKLSAIYPLQYPIFNLNISKKQPTMFTTTLFLGGSIAVILFFNKYKTSSRLINNISNIEETTHTENIDAVNEDLEENVSDSENSENNDVEKEQESDSDNNSVTYLSESTCNDSDNDEKSSEKEADVKTNSSASSKTYNNILTNWFSR
tara:strand:+ start:5979 stop:6662 length:684 start_codon:yes stop_codon:yes gene_type:complete